MNFITICILWVFPQQLDKVLNWLQININSLNNISFGIYLFICITLFYILGVDRFLELVKDAEEEYEKDYRIEYERLREAKKEAEKVWILYI